jgi:hypothetical protein
MRDIDLEPKSVRFWDQKTGRWQTRISRKFARGYALLCLIVLGAIFWYRSELTPGVLFGLTAAFALGAGVMLANWLFDLY